MRVVYSTRLCDDNDGRDDDDERKREVVIYSFRQIDKYVRRAEDGTKCWTRRERTRASRRKQNNICRRSISFPIEARRFSMVNKHEKTSDGKNRIEQEADAGFCLFFLFSSSLSLRLSTVLVFPSCLFFPSNRFSFRLPMKVMSHCHGS